MRLTLFGSKNSIWRRGWSRDAWPFDKPLISWSKSDAFTIGDSYEGCLGLGATGSGKTTGLAETVALAMMRAGYGGFVSVFKGDELERWQSYARKAGRRRDLIEFSPDRPWKFNFLNYELERGGCGAGITENIVSLLSTALEIAEQISGNAGAAREEGQYWELTKRQICRNTVDVLILARGKVSIPDLYEFIITAPTSVDEIAKTSWQERSFCYRCILEAEQKATTPRQKRDFNLAVTYFFDDFARLSDKTRSIVVSTVTSMVDMLNRGIGRELLCTETNITPEAMEQGHVIFAGLPVVEYGPLGRLVQGILRHSFQLGIQRRNVRKSPRPVFFFADEFQEFVTSYDRLFQSTCRSARVASVYLSQNVPNIVAALGGQQKGQAECDSLFGNLNLKVFHANSDPTTNNYASQLIGQTKQLLMNTNSGHAPDDWTSLVLGMGSSQASGGFSETYYHEVPPSVFSSLRTGGQRNGRVIEAIVFRSGRIFSDTGRNWRLVTFQQSRT
ncbi:MAG: TraM recognition domain-containing protein [Pirellulales bacterium]|nr:TraM recognition domain-containing protein [Pirellulales bacterium]